MLNLDVNLASVSTPSIRVAALASSIVVSRMFMVTFRLLLLDQLVGSRKFDRFRIPEGRKFEDC